MFLRSLFIALSLVLSVNSHAQTPAVDHSIEINASLEAAIKTAVKGAADVALMDQATIKLPANHYFFKQQESARFLRALGNKIVKDPIGVIVPENLAWITIIEYVNQGYIKDDDAKNWNATELLATIKANTDLTNKERVERGFKEIEILEWVEAPLYDSSSNRLVWSLLSQQKGADTTRVKSVNYNTYALGRYGYIILEMLSNQTNIEKDKIIAGTLLNNITYNEGHKYSDFNAATDKVASYGLAALVGAGMAKKLGLFATIGIFLAKFGKFLLIPLIFGGGFVMRLFKKKNEPHQPPSA